MQTNKMMLSMALLLTLSTACFAAEPSDATADAKAVDQATAQFYTSLNALFAGDAGPMNETWSHADDVTYMGPVGGFQVGWDQVSAVWEAQAALKLGGKVEARERHVTIGNDLAFVHCYEIGDNLDSDGDAEDVSIRATTLLRKENGQWKVIGHHTDLLPFLGQETVTSASE